MWETALPAIYKMRVLRSSVRISWSWHLTVWNWNYFSVLFHMQPASSGGYMWNKTLKYFQNYFKIILFHMLPRHTHSLFCWYSLCYTQSTVSNSKQINGNGSAVAMRVQKAVLCRSPMFRHSARHQSRLQYHRQEAGAWRGVPVCHQITLLGDRGSEVQETCLRLSLIHIWRCRRSYACRSRWSPYH